MNEFSSIEHVAKIISIQSDEYDNILSRYSPFHVALIDGTDIWLKGEKDLPILSDFKNLKFDFHSDRQTAIKINKTIFITANNPKNTGFTKINIRAAIENWTPELTSDITLGTQLLSWSENCLFCAKCGEPLEVHTTSIAKVCEHCERDYYPSLTPVVIVLITRQSKNGLELLLAKGLSPKNYYSCVAGHVEPGENLERAVKREVLEEVGVFIENLKYFSSQSWPFPNKLMMGFTADWKSGEIHIDPTEITDAQWFTKDKLPVLAAKNSIARLMIDSV